MIAANATADRYVCVSYPLGLRIRLLRDESACNTGVPVVLARDRTRLTVRSRAASQLARANCNSVACDAARVAFFVVLPAQPNQRCPFLPQGGRRGEGPVGHQPRILEVHIEAASAAIRCDRVSKRNGPALITGPRARGLRVARSRCRRRARAPGGGQALLGTPTLSGYPAGRERLRIASVSRRRRCRSRSHGV